jgi:hypothetical protein
MPSQMRDHKVRRKLENVVKSLTTKTEPDSLTIRQMGRCKDDVWFLNHGHTVVMPAFQKPSVSCIEFQNFA